MARVLDFVYTDTFSEPLSDEWLTPAGVGSLFDAADMLLLFSMKVRVRTQWITTEVAPALMG